MLFVSVGLTFPLEKLKVGRRKEGKKAIMRVVNEICTNECTDAN